MRIAVRVLEKKIDECVDLLRKGYSEYKIMKKLKLQKEIFENVYEIARCRIAAKNKFSRKNLYFDTYGLRYSTPEIIGIYRSNRIKNFRIADLSCGVGFQAIFYSFTNRSVLGIDISQKRVEYAKHNAIVYNANNIEFIVGNSLSDRIQKIVRDYDILYLDPARAEREDERNLYSLLPSPLKIIKRHGLNRNYIFDLPPQISLDKISNKWGKEFISINGKIVRFTTYMGNIIKHNRVAVSLPSGESFWSDEILRKENTKIKSSKLSNYIYIVDESLYYAHLLEDFSMKTEIEYLQKGKRRTLATGEFVKSAFLRPFFVVCTGTSLDAILKCMRSERIGKITLRFSIPPDDYWKYRKKIEKKIKGESKGSLFRIGETWVGAKNVT